MMLALATLPTRMLPSSRTAMTLAVVASPAAFGSTRAAPSRITATQELLVPRPMPIASSAMPPRPGGRPPLGYRQMGRSPEGAGLRPEAAGARRATAWQGAVDACYSPCKSEGLAMSGHSKWATIRRKKGALDAKRGKIFTKLIREIATAARLGGGEPGANPRLRLAVDKARAANMPKDNIERAILKGTGGADSESWEEAIYEGYGPGGAAVLVEALTDNRNRTAGEVRHVFTKFGGNLGGSGCVAHLFERRGSLAFERAGLDPDALIDAAIGVGGDDGVGWDVKLTVETTGGK